MKRINWKRLKKGIFMAVAGVLALGSPIQACAESSSNYCYDSVTKKYFNAPMAYEVERVLYAYDLEGVDTLSGISSIYVKDDRIYLATATSVVTMNRAFEVEHILSEYTDENGNKASISGVTDVFVTDDDKMYVCEAKNARVLVFDENRKLLHNYGQPKGLELTIAYQPTQIVVDSLDRMYIIANNVYEGILEINSKNEFQRYFGETTIKYSPLDLLWRQLATEEQKAKQVLWLPTEYSSMVLDKTGFIYASVSSTEEEKPIRLLNVQGTNILAYDEKEGEYPAGDIVYGLAGSGVTGGSSLTDIDCNEYGMYTVLDIKRNRIFTYDENGSMLFVFGGKDDKEGCFRSPVSIRLLGDDILVADNMSESITVMTPTKYGQTILDATKLDYMGREEEGIAYWEEVLKMNPHLEIAYDAIARAALREKDYEKAADYFYQANNRTYYSKAYEKTRSVVIKENITGVFIGVVVLIVVWKGVGFLRKRNGKVK